MAIDVGRKVNKGVKRTSQNRTIRTPIDCDDDAYFAAFVSNLLLKGFTIFLMLVRQRGLNTTLKG